MLVSKWKILPLSGVVRESDVINLQKMKTHGQMLLSFGLKNLFGCVMGRSKAAWHYDVGLDRDRFAALLLDIYKVVAPALTILDGIIGMDRGGPTSGNPYPYGMLAAVQDALSMDFWLCRMMGVRLEDFSLWRAAHQRAMPECVLNEEDIAGGFSPGYRFDDVKLPDSRSLRLAPRIPLLGSVIERVMTSRPTHRTMYLATDDARRSAPPVPWGTWIYALTTGSASVIIAAMKCAPCRP